jgi:hypothetical protein
MGASKTADGIVKLERCRESLRERRELWRDCCPGDLWWDLDYRVFWKRPTAELYRYLFGNGDDLRLVLSKRGLPRKAASLVRLVGGRRLEGPFDLGLELPACAAVIPANGSKEGVVVISLEDGMVLKVNYNRHEVAREVENRELIRNAGLQRHVPEMISYGTGSEGAEWLVTRFVPNLNPLSRSLNPFANKERLWRHWLRRKILPALEQYYEAAGIREVTLTDYLEQEREHIFRENMPPQLAAVAEMGQRAARRALEQKAVITSIHKDLLPCHLHRTGNDWWIIDWGSSAQGFLAREFFRAYFWRPVATSESHRAFWIWLREGGDGRSLPPGLREDVEAYISWHWNWRRIPLDYEAVRAQLIAAVLRSFMKQVRVYGAMAAIPEREELEQMPCWLRHMPNYLEILCDNLAGSSLKTPRSGDGARLLSS